MSRFVFGATIFLASLAFLLTVPRQQAQHNEEEINSSTSNDMHIVGVFTYPNFFFRNKNEPFFSGEHIIIMVGILLPDANEINQCTIEAGLYNDKGENVIQTISKIKQFNPFLSRRLTHIVRLAINDNIPEGQYNVQLSVVDQNTGQQRHCELPCIIKNWPLKISNFQLNGTDLQRVYMPGQQLNISGNIIGMQTGEGGNYNVALEVFYYSGKEDEYRVLGKPIIVRQTNFQYDNNDNKFIFNEYLSAPHEGFCVLCIRVIDYNSKKSKEISIPMIITEMSTFLEVLENLAEPLPMR